MRISRLGLLGLLAIGSQAPALGQDSATKPPPPKWSIACASASVDADLQCRMTQELFTAEGRQRILAVTVARSASGGFEMTLAIPHGAMLPAGLLLKIDDREPVKVAIESSNAAGVYARIPLDEALGAAVKRGYTMSVGITNRSGNLVQIPVTLAGFTAGLARITAVK